MEDNLRWETTFYERLAWMEDDHGWKMTLDGRRPLIEDNPKRGQNFETCNNQKEDEKVKLQILSVFIKSGITKPWHF